jgi:choline dehydrogenase
MLGDLHADCFDYIVVGAGTAGCVLANRLTASGRHRVLLLEAGGSDRNIWIHIPLGYGKLFSDGNVNWLYSSEPEPELNNRKIIQPRGKVLGGSSSINGLLYIRGQPEDFDHWRQLGNAGWSFEDVLPYFRRAEDQERGEDALHGVGGRSRSPTSANRIRNVRLSSRRRNRQAFRATMILTGPPRKAPGIST